MKTGLDHLPPQKQQEIGRIVRIVFEEFEDALSLASRDWKINGKILKIILYGSHARGDWVYEPNTRVGKNSDWDLLIIVNDERLTDYMEYWSDLGKRLRLEFERTHRLVSPVQFRSEEHTSELQSLMRISYAVFCLKKKNIKHMLSLLTTTLTIYHHKHSTT